MKIFIPMANADLPLDDEITGKLVPFDPSFLKSQTAKGDGFKPRNWVSEFHIPGINFRKSISESHLGCHDG